MVVLIFDTCAGLCNQFYDIVSGINFCLIHNIRFTFRYCSFRNSDLTSWTEEPFEKLFDLKLFEKYELYVDYYTIKDKLNDTNSYNLNNTRIAISMLKYDNILEQIYELNKEYVVLKQFWAVYKFRSIVDNTIVPRIRPCNDIIEKYNEIKNALIDQPYNFIHYRYEKDFTNFFQLDIESLDSLIERISFNDNSLKIYIATSNIKNLIDIDNCKYKKLLYKDDDILVDLNFEQRAFIDYMFGLDSVQCYGHQKSAFSGLINNMKKTSNFYA